MALRHEPKLMATPNASLVAIVLTVDSRRTLPKGDGDKHPIASNSRTWFGALSCWLWTKALREVRRRLYVDRYLPSPEYLEAPLAKKRLVNLDALIPRDDFLVSATEAIPPADFASSMKVTDLERDSFTYHTLRKPDFQRETANWDPDKVAELVKSFLEGDLIPSVILWRSSHSGNIFVIDGAHRLSALIAWVHDDYGDSHTSTRFFDKNIPDEQKRAAKETRDLISKSVGSFEDLRQASRNPDTADEERVRLARNLSAYALTLQWVRGEHDKAESSFFKINQQATPIDKTELAIIKSRRKPNAVAARALLRAGTGHKYWSAFNPEIQEEIESIAVEVYDLLFKPSLDQSIRNTDLPVAGKGYSADSLKMILELVNYVNNIKDEMWLENSHAAPRRGKAATSTSQLENDVDGAQTLAFMKRVRRAALRIAGNHPSSLALHPAVYFYSATGQFQPSAFLATIRFVLELTQRNRLIEFTKVRSKFEEFLVQYKYFMNQLVRQHGGIPRSIDAILVMFQVILENIATGITDGEIIEAFSGLAVLRPIKVRTAVDYEHKREFTRETKVMIRLQEILDKASLCGICGSRLPLKLSSVDHILRKEDGGLGEPRNAQLTHPYCNSGFKEHLNSLTIAN